MKSELLEVQNFVNATMGSAEAGFHADGSIPAMTTPTVIFTPTAVQYIIVGSTICLVC